MTKTPEPLTEAELRWAVKLAFLLAERNPESTEEARKLLAAARTNSPILRRRFETLYNNATSGGNHILTDEERQSFGKALVRLDEHAQSQQPLPAVPDLAGGPIYELRNEMNIERSELAREMGVNETALRLIETGSRPLEPNVAIAAYGVAVRAGVRESLIEWLAEVQ